MNKDKPIDQAGTVNLRRLYVDCRYGQLHVHSSFASNGGFDERTTLLCVHPHGTTGRVFTGLLRVKGADRSVYAPDLPGSGESDAAPRDARAAGLSAAIGDFLDQLRLRKVDLLGCRSGAGIALELALARPQQVGRLVLADPPATDDPQLPAHDRLRHLGQPVLLLRPTDRPRELAAAWLKQLPAARLIDLSQPGAGLFEALPQAISTFLD
jgi:pimeloyl-ACP methyl ester carboxylesterase